jgi:5'-deoxynucleotidase
MRNTIRENVEEHSLQVAVIAHSLALIRKIVYKGGVSPEKVVTAAIYHDAHEVITGDMATPIKYFNPEIKRAYKEIEKLSGEKLLSLLPEIFRDEYKSYLLFDNNQEITELVKAADKISAYIKCVEELKAGNQEFEYAKKSILENINSINLPEVKYFMEHFAPSYNLTIDELN